MLTVASLLWVTLSAPRNARERVETVGDCGWSATPWPWPGLKQIVLYLSRKSLNPPEVVFMLLLVSDEVAQSPGDCSLF